MIIPIVMFYKLLPKNVSHAAGYRSIVYSIYYIKSIYYSKSYVRVFQYVVESKMRISIEETRSPI